MIVIRNLINRGRIAPRACTSFHRLGTRSSPCNTSCIITRDIHSFGKLSYSKPIPKLGITTIYTHPPDKAKALPSVQSPRLHVRHIGTTPTSTGLTRVQHVRFTAGKTRWWNSVWFTRLVAMLLFMRIYGQIAKSQDDAPKDVSDVKKTIQSVKSLSQEEKAGANAEPVSQEGEDEQIIEIDDDDGWFIPFGWPTRKPPIAYKGTDDEWKEFVKFSSDKVKREGVRGQAAQFIEILVEHNPQLNKILGKPTKITAHWIDIDYPTHYSEGYEITGFFITDTILAWAARDYDENTIDRFLKVISPVPLMTAFWEVTKHMYTGQEGLVTKVKEHEKLPVGIPGIPDLHATPGLEKVVGKNLKKLRKPIFSSSVPRGCIMLSGRVDVTGSRHWATFSFLGFYDPKREGWHEMPRVSLDHIRPLKLVPKG